MQSKAALAAQAARDRVGIAAVQDEMQCLEGSLEELREEVKLLNSLQRKAHAAALSAALYDAPVRALIRNRPATTPPSLRGQELRRARAGLRASHMLAWSKVPRRF